MTRGPVWGADGTLEHIGAPEWLGLPDLQSLMSAFEEAGHEIYAVGGCVRDTVLDRPVFDVDLSTDAVPEHTGQIVTSLGGGWKAVPTGVEHGTLTAVSPEGRAFEVTTFRNDVETHGRRATVAFSTRIEDDAIRRDFTINALYADRRGGVRDVVGGSEDLRARRIRFIGSPEARIEEDYLRILRFFRFTASHGRRDIGIDAKGLAACATLAEGLVGISRERVGAEMTRLIAVPDPAPIIGSMEQSGVLARILPGAGVLALAMLVDLEQNVPDRLTQAAAPDVPTRLAALGCADVAERLRLSKAQTRKIARVTEAAASTVPPHELGYRYGYTDALHCLLLRWATLMLPVDEAALDDAQTGAAAVFPVTASDLMPRYEGPALGDRLKDLETRWIDSRFNLNKSDLLALA